MEHRKKKTKQQLILGTAMWAWTIPKKRCFQLLDSYYELGGREVDAATNYPINKKIEDFRAAEKILVEWLKANEVKDMQVMMKVGSLNNLRTPDHNLSPSFLMMTAHDYRYLLGSNLSSLMIHWDNRADSAAIAESLEVLQNWQSQGLNIGFSGIKHPNAYAEALKSIDLKPFRIQIKHNLLYSDYEGYQPLHENATFIAYGINAGGVKLKKEAYSDNASLKARGGKHEANQILMESLNKTLASYKRKTSLSMPERMNHLGLLYALYHPRIEQILLGVSSIEQLHDSWSWVERLEANDYSDLYQTLLNQTLK